jgi:hypothetical protein
MFLEALVNMVICLSHQQLSAFLTSFHSAVTIAKTGPFLRHRIFFGVLEASRAGRDGVRTEKGETPFSVESQGWRRSDGWDH